MKPRSFNLLFILIAHLLFTQMATAQNDNANTPKAQKRIFAVKAGTSYSLMQDLKSFSVSNNFGFFVGVYFAAPSSSRLGFRSELLLSRQGYDYASGRQSGNVVMTYIMMPQVATIKLTRFLELHAGPQLALLLSAGVDSSANPSSIPNLEEAASYFNRLNYGLAAGFELSPSKSSFIGARYNLFFDMYKEKTGTGYPAYVPDYNGNLKNGLVQLYLGLRF